MGERADIQEQLRGAIKTSGQSLNQLGQAAGVDSGRLSRFMRGERDLTLEPVGRMCQILGLEFCQTKAPPPAKKAPRKRKEKS
jgi:transcriptional regulator with XRE-family HTH domain